MSFAEPHFLLGLILIPIMGLFLAWAERRRRVAVAALGDSALIRRLSASVNRPGRRARNWLWFVVIALAVIALARPQWGSEVRILEQEGVQIMVALDISNSMLAQDSRPDRLGRAKLEVMDLMNHLGGDEVGLVLFSGASFIQFPLTFDYSTARSFLDRANPSLISRPGTAIGSAIDTALTGFDPQRASQKVIIIMTDGEDHEGEALAAASRATEQGVIIYTVGFGSPEGEPIPEYDASGQVVGFMRDDQGQVVLSILNEDMLQKVALAANGTYYPVGVGGTPIADLVDDLDSLQKAKIQSELETRRVERFQLFLVVALLALVAGELIPDRPVPWLARRKDVAG